jgi:N-acetylglucosaminyldiphosphoundecaprenol N-acetyl-beta-D-mannosaminyltransferase
MNHWMDTDLDDPPRGDGSAMISRTAPLGDARLRCMDLLLLALAASLLLLLLPLVVWAAVAGQLQGNERLGAHHRLFYRWRWHFPATPGAKVLHWLGAGHWPVLINILHGDMAWVGPRARDIGEAPGPAAHLRPGVTGLHQLRQATAVDFVREQDSEAQYAKTRGLLSDLRLLVLAMLAMRVRSGARGGHTAGTVHHTVQIVDVRLDNLLMQTALERVMALVAQARPAQVSFVNPACVNIAARHAEYRQILASSALVLPDGIGMTLASEWLGTPIRQNVNGTDFFPRLCQAMNAHGQRLYLLGGRPEVVDRVAELVGQRWPLIRVVGARHGFVDPDNEAAVVQDIRQSRAQVVLVAMGVPLQERFIARHLQHMGPCVAMGVGGLFDFVAGRIARAPQWMRDAGLEWVWRLMQEPHRMWRRYLVGNVSFLARVALQRAGWRRPKT